LIALPLLCACLYAAMAAASKQPMVCLEKALSLLCVFGKLLTYWKMWWVVLVCYLVVFTNLVLVTNEGELMQPGHNLKWAEAPA